MYIPCWIILLPWVCCYVQWALLISGDFNIHVDVPTDADSLRYRDLRGFCGTASTACKILIYVSPVNLMTSSRKEPAVVLCHLRRAKTTSTVWYPKFQKLKAIDKQKFLEDIRISLAYVLLQHPPPPGIRLLWKLLFKSPPPIQAKMPFKCPTVESMQVIKCPHPGNISQAHKWQKDGRNAFSCQTKSL